MDLRSICISASPVTVCLTLKVTQRSLSMSFRASAGGTEARSSALITETDLPAFIGLLLCVYLGSPVRQTDYSLCGRRLELSLQSARSCYLRHRGFVQSRRSRFPGFVGCPDSPSRH